MAIKKKSKPEQVVGITEMVDFLMQMPEIAESFTTADLELALDDRGWTNYGSGMPQAGELDPNSRMMQIKKARIYWQRDPLAKQAVRLWTDYALGNGISYKAEDEATQERLDKFCRHRRNRQMMSSDGQRKRSKRLLIDGEVFFALFKGKDGTPILRTIDPMQITDIITDPDDDETVLAYKRITSSGKTLYYRDWTVDEELESLLDKVKDPATRKTITVEDDVVVYHRPFDALFKRGNGLLSCILDWTREHRRFMEARVAITQALAKFAWKATVKGGQATVNAIKKRLESSHAASGHQSVEKNPQPAPGSTWTQNNGIDMTPMPRTTGGTEARDDSDSLKLMVAAGTGIMVHYFGDPSTGNLATATAMELPMLKMFESYQQLWIDTYRDLFSIVLDEDPSDPEVIDIDLPPILNTDLGMLSSFVTSVASVFPEIKIEEILQMLLHALGVNNIDDVLKKMAKKRAEIDAQQAELQAAIASMRPPAGGPPQQQEETYRQLEQAVKLLAEVLR